MLRIGIDFDNTIACYDRSFPEVAEQMGLVTRGVTASKADLKSKILCRPSGELDWQRLQGQVYGKHMLSAEIFPGFLEFLLLSRIRGYAVFIVSHKSEFGHFDESRVSLRDQAFRWLELNRLLEEENLGLSRKNVFFESTRDDKVSRICSLGCTHFIDDLREVFEESRFPVGTQKVLFQTNSQEPDYPGAIMVSSWRDLSQRIYGVPTEHEVGRMVMTRFPEIEPERVKLLKGRGNSRIYELAGKRGPRFALKVYPDRQRDPRPRLETEFSACRELHRRGYPVLEPYAADRDLGWAIYPWIDGVPVELPDSAFLSQALEFVRRLYADSRNEAPFSQLAQASEACLSGAEISRQIEARLERLLPVKQGALEEYLDREFVPEFVNAVALAKFQRGEMFAAELPRTLQMLSPSDFGSHNALCSDSGRFTFIDFEYFGWDDPVKLAADVYWHPGMSLAAEQRKQWIAECVNIFKDDFDFPRRLQSCLPLIGLRWCLILLNEFLAVGAGNRMHANPEKFRDVTNICSIQLSKSRKLLREIKETIYDNGSTVQVS